MHKSTKFLIFENIIIIFIGLLFIPISMGHNIPLPLPYLWHKWLHILGVLIFLGNIIITGIWMFAIEKSKNENFIKFAVIFVNWADVIFTGPGIILLFVNGILLSQSFGGLKTEHWIQVAVGLFILSGLIWNIFLIPIQNKLAIIAEDQSPLNSDFFHYLKKWYLWGVIATVIPLLTMVLMVVKPII
ncbi:MAG: DUF2269 domain-containing protein [Bacteriovoracaceae bacterium]|nr:DUF2269 domain-containing protein [Bacteriovoracaceae bacterium]